MFRNRARATIRLILTSLPYSGQSKTTNTFHHPPPPHTHIPPSPAAPAAHVPAPPATWPLRHQPCAGPAHRQGCSVRRASPPAPARCVAQSGAGGSAGCATACKHKIRNYSGLIQREQKPFCVLTERNESKSHSAFSLSVTEQKPFCVLTERNESKSHSAFSLSVTEQKPFCVLTERNESKSHSAFSLSVAEQKPFCDSH